MSERFRLQVNGVPREVTVLVRERDRVVFAVGGRSYEVILDPELPEPSSRASDWYGGKDPRKPHAPKPPRPTGSFRSGLSSHAVVAPIPGIVVAILVAPGDEVRQGEVVMRLEAMKMENNIFAPSDGVVAAIHVTEGDEVGDGELLLELA